MKKTVFMIAMFFMATPVGAQPAKIDSLLMALEKAQDDTTRISIYSTLVETEPDVQKWQSYNEKIKALSDKGLKTAKGELRTFYLKYQAIYLNNLGYTYKSDGQSVKALDYYQQSLRLSKKINNKLVMSNVLNNIGYVHKIEGRINLAIDYYNQSLKLKNELGDKKGQATLLNNIGIIYHSQGNLLKALENYQKSIQLREEIGDKKGIAYTYNGLGGIYEAVGDTVMALSYYKKSYRIKQELGDHQGQLSSMGNIGNMFRVRGDTVSAFRIYKRALQIGKEIESKSGIALALNNLGFLYKEQNKLDIALKMFEESLALRKEIGDKQGEANSLDNAGSIYELQHRYDQATRCFIQSLEISQSIGFIDNIRRSAQSLYRLYKSQGNTNKALQMHELFMQMTDSVNNDNTRREVFKSQFKYEYDRKAATDSLKAVEEKKAMDAKIEKERTEQRIQRYALTAGIFVLFIIAFFVFQRFRLKQRVKELKIRNKIASDLHDEVGSALSSISLLSGMAGMQGEVQQKTIKKIETTSRETLENMSDIVWSIQPRNDKLTDVVNRMKNYGQQLFTSLETGFEFIQQGEIPDLPLNMEQRKSLYLIYKEALNNAAKYSGAKKITVNISNQSKQVTLVIADDGKGFDTYAQRAGNGLYTMEERARILNGSLHMQSSPGQGAVITLRFKTT